MPTHSEPITVTLTKSYPCSSAVLWRALTDLEEMHQWYFEQIPAFKAEEGFEVRFDVYNESRHFPHRWIIKKVVPYRKLGKDWIIENYPGQGYVTFEIFPRDHACELKLTNTGLETFPQDVPEFKEESCRGGWEYFMGRLYDFVNTD
ncbi:MAG: SRPBCC domain-containing protein [Flavobacteriales bacterium]|nr:SRPBCC domain-containing protein [Flavobacteriales bacterium]